MKSLVAVASGTPDDRIALECAAAIAAKQGGHIEVLPVFPDPAADLIYYGATLSRVEAVARDRLAQAEREAQGSIEVMAREIANAHGLNRQERAPSIDVAGRSLAPAVALAEAALLSDLVVFSGAALRDSVSLSNLFAETLLTTRAPVLVAKATPLDVSAIALAWDGSAEAARAVKAAVPLLHGAARLLVISNIDDGRGGAETIATPRLEQYLRRRGLAALEYRSVEGADVAHTLLQAARDSGCGLLVAGGYGRPRLFELVLGGTTRRFVRAEGVPSLLLAH
jgi:nucleotide-binding universal stress UspA family protein